MAWCGAYGVGVLWDRRIGKSALVEEFIEQQQVPSVFYTAEIGFGGEPLREFSDAVRISGLREAQVFQEAVPGNLAAALRQLAGVLARAAGGIAHSTLTRAADLLISKGVVSGELPAGLAPSKERRYRITDSYLRFWLAFLGPHLAEVDRMRSDLTLARIERSWTDWRGRAVEPLARAALARLLPAQGIPAAPVIGGYWTRGNDVEIDIVGADREPVARQLLFLGSVKWLETGQFDAHDLVALQRHRDRVIQLAALVTPCSGAAGAGGRRGCPATRPAGGLNSATPRWRRTRTASRDARRRPGRGEQAVQVVVDDGPGLAGGGLPGEDAGGKAR